METKVLIGQDLRALWNEQEHNLALPNMIKLTSNGSFFDVIFVLFYVERLLDNINLGA
jgi:hypothetical protein